VEHDPQWFGSVSRFTHLVPHSVVLAGQAHRPPLQPCPPVHTIPQPPQLASSIATSTHAAAHAIEGATHPGAQALALHTVGGAQLRSHPPQWSGLAERSMHVPPQFDFPAGQAQAPDEQMNPGEHVFPHPPQFVALAVGSTQPPPQAVAGGPHPCELHAPFAQTSPFLHSVPQLPQFEGLELVSTHTAPQSTWPSGQKHRPASQASPLAHAVLHAPQ
jgi:hypothetical protein